MTYKLLDCFILIIHFLFILFMISGFLFNVYALIFNRNLLNFFYLRIIHLIGIIFVFSLEVMGRYCPLTILENYFYRKTDPSLVYQGSFIIHYLEKIIYPEVSPLAIIIPTGVIAGSTLLIFILHPPKKKEK